MAKINKGISLIELIVYMSIFFVIFTMITYSTFYMQKIIQNNNQNYYVKNQIYFNINILQQYLFKTTVKLYNNELKFYDKNHNLILTQVFENNQLKNIYKYKSFNAIDNVNFKDIKIDILENNTIIKYEVSWLDNNNKTHSITEYLIVINQNM